METVKGSTAIRSALFVDFDNIFLTLRDLISSDAAENFKNFPEIWLDWLQNRVRKDYVDKEKTERRFLVRRCYSNPYLTKSFQRQFMAAGFEIIDCHPVTQGKKNSADIYMVLDILDNLEHETRIDEFIILSGDSDFRPVLLRIRRHDRASVIMGIGSTSDAYRAIADYVIDDESFAREALDADMSDEEDDKTDDLERRPANGGNGKGSQILLTRMAQRLVEIASQDGMVQANDLPRVYREFPEFSHSSDWLGFGKLRGLTRGIVETDPRLQMVDNKDIWWVEIAPPSPAEKAFVEVERPLAGKTDFDLARDKDDGIYLRMTDFIQRLMAEAPRPQTLATIATKMMQNFPELSDRTWLGTNSFKGLLGRLNLSPLKIHPVGPSYLYNPARHTLPSESEESAAETLSGQVSDLTSRFQNEYPDLAPLAMKLFTEIDIPFLLPEHYKTVFEQIARTINERGFKLSETSRVSCERCVERGVPLSRTLINFILRGIYFTGYRYKTDHDENGKTLAEQFYQNVLTRANTNDLPLSPEDEIKIRRWIVGDDSAGQAEFASLETVRPLPGPDSEEGPYLPSHPTSESPEEEKPDSVDAW